MNMFIKTILFVVVAFSALSVTAAEGDAAEEARAFERFRSLPAADNGAPGTRYKIGARSIIPSINVVNNVLVNDYAPTAQEKALLYIVCAAIYPHPNEKIETSHNDLDLKGRLRLSPEHGVQRMMTENNNVTYNYVTKTLGAKNVHTGLVEILNVDDLNRAMRKVTGVLHPCIKPSDDV